MSSACLTNLPTEGRDRNRRNRDLRNRAPHVARRVRGLRGGGNDTRKAATGQRRSSAPALLIRLGAEPLALSRPRIRCWAAAQRRRTVGAADPNGCANNCRPMRRFFNADQNLHASLGNNHSVRAGLRKCQRASADAGSCAPSSGKETTVTALRGRCPSAISSMSATAAAPARKRVPSGSFASPTPVTPGSTFAPPAARSAGHA